MGTPGSVRFQFERKGYAFESAAARAQTLGYAARRGSGHDRARPDDLPGGRESRGRRNLGHRSDPVLDRGRLFAGLETGRKG